MKIFFLLFLACVMSLADVRSLSCRENCQYFDDFDRVCNYRTQCLYDGNRCMTSLRCERWDDFDRRCLYESKFTQCYTPHPFLPPPACQISCQYWDNFENKCLYETQCQYFGANCVAVVRCERWDDFDRKCLSEERTLQCP